jgi:diguanylate cyclase (GGDEF)-like protein/PAS domain S-box-containing protein
MILWEELLPSLAVVAIATSIWTLMHRYALKMGRRGATLAFSVVISFGILATMAVPIHFAPGILMDARYPFLAVAGYFGGPLATILPVMTAIARRLVLGGTGVWVAVPQIAAATGGGLLLRHLLKGPVPSLKGVAVLSVWAACSGVIGFYWHVPMSRWLQLTTDTTGPFVVILCTATLIFGIALLQELKRHAATQENWMYRAVIEALPDCLNAKDDKGRFVVANPATANLMGTDVAGLIGRTDADFYGTATAEAFRKPELQVLATGKSVTVEQKFFRLDGTETWLSTLKAPLFNDAGRPVGVVTHNREITEGKKIEQELYSTQLRLANAVDSMADGLAMFSANGVLLFHNRRFHELFPLTADVRVPGNCIRAMVRASLERGEEAAPLSCPDDVVERTADILLKPGDRLMRLADGRSVEARTRATGDAGIMIVFSDVTEQREREKRLHELNQQLAALANTDALTGLMNRRAFNEAVRASLQPEKVVSLLMVDVDRFKAFNDGYGHLEGDECLRQVADILKDVFGHVRSATVARYGGEEFVVIMPDIDLAQAVSTAAIACAAVRAAAIRHDFSETKIVTVSIGVASTRSCAVAELLKSADTALYAAKAAGRDCVRSSRADTEASFAS